MIEQAMVFTLGFCVAGLLSLMIAPAFRRRAERLARRRLEMQLPLSARDIAAERDQLRAQFAVEQRRIEQKAEALNMAHAADLSELGRRAAQILEMSNELAVLDARNTDLGARLADLDRQFAESTATAFASTKALYDSDGVYERLRDDKAALVAALDAAETLAAQRHASLSALQTRAAGLDLRLDAVTADLQTAETRLRQKTIEIEEAAHAIAVLRADGSSLQANRERLQAALNQEKARARTLADMNAELESRGASDMAKFTTLRFEADRQMHELEAAVAREAALRDEYRARVHEHEKSVVEKIEGLQREAASLRGALAAARAELDRLRIQTAHASPAASKLGLAMNEAADAALLRQAISDVGAAVLRATTTPQETAGQAEPGKALQLEVASEASTGL